MSTTPRSIPFPEDKRVVQARLSVAEHEVYLAFNSDWHAAAFMDWLHERGFHEFTLWAEGHKERYL